MHALNYAGFDVLEIAEVDIPRPMEDEVLLKIAACGICGSELESFKTHSERRKPPLIMGHEFCGTVVATGSKENGHLVGRRFVSNSIVPCGRCVRCQRGDTHLCAHRQLFGMHRPGAFAEYAAVPTKVLIPWPDELPATTACLAEPLANGIHVVNLTRHIAVRTALVIGAGPIGLMCQQTIQALRGAQVMVCDLSAGRLQIAARLGASRTLCTKTEDVVAAALQWTDGEGVDLVIDAAGTAATKRLALAALRPGGATVWIGLHTNTMQVDTYEVTLPEKQVLGTYAATQSELAEALELMRAGKVDVASWTETAGLDQSADIFARMLHPGESNLKGIISISS